MPETAQPNDLYLVRFFGRIEGQETVNIFHFRNVTADNDVLTHLILVLIQCFVANLLPVLTSSWTFEKVVWQKVGPVLGVENITITADMHAGGGNASALPSFNSVVFSKRTLLGGKSHRGRLYIAGIPEVATIGSKLDTAHAFWLAALAFAACVLQNFKPGDPPGANSWQYGVYSSKIGGTKAPLGLNGFTPVETLTPAQELGTTRSRKVGRGS